MLMGAGAGAGLGGAAGLGYRKLADNRNPLGLVIESARSGKYQPSARSAPLPGMQNTNARIIDPSTLQLPGGEGSLFRQLGEPHPQVLSATALTENDGPVPISDEEFSSRLMRAASRARSENKRQSRATFNGELSPEWAAETATSVKSRPGLPGVVHGKDVNVPPSVFAAAPSSAGDGIHPALLGALLGGGAGALAGAVRPGKRGRLRSMLMGAGAGAGLGGAAGMGVRQFS